MDLTIIIVCVCVWEGGEGLDVTTYSAASAVSVDRKKKNSFTKRVGENKWNDPPELSIKSPLSLLLFRLLSHQEDRNLPAE